MDPQADYADPAPPPRCRRLARFVVVAAAVGGFFLAYYIVYRFVDQWNLSPPP